MFEFKTKSFKTFFIPDDASVFLQNSSIWDKKAGGGSRTRMEMEKQDTLRRRREWGGGVGEKTYLEQIEY